MTTAAPSVEAPSTADISSLVSTCIEMPSVSKIIERHAHYESAGKDPRSSAGTQGNAGDPRDPTGHASTAQSGRSGFADARAVYERNFVNGQFFHSIFPFGMN